MFFTFVDTRNGWLIRTTAKSFAVYAATSTEKQEWMAHINKCIEDLLRKSKMLSYTACSLPYHYLIRLLYLSRHLKVAKNAQINMLLFGSPIAKLMFVCVVKKHNSQ